MTKAFYKKHTGIWFEGKRGIMLESTENNGGQKIKAGEKITITHKFGRGGLCVKSNKGVYIKGIEPWKIDLI